MLEINAFGSISINGENTKFERDTIHNQLIKMLAMIKSNDLPASRFSSIQITLSKRPMDHNDSTSNDPFEKMLNDHSLPISQVSDDDLMEGYNNITWGEYVDLMNDSVFTQKLKLARKINIDKFTQTEIDQINRDYDEIYRATKFHQIIEGFKH